MRPSNRLLSSLKAGRLLEPYAPTGLTGLFTHPAPRSTLIYLYNATLDKLKHLPESSVYRQSTEALTKHRLSIVESKKPASYDEWAEKVRVQVAQNPDAFNSAEGGAGRYSKHDVQGKSFIRMREIEESDERTEEWDGEQEASEIEGSQTSADRAHQKALGNDSTGRSIELESLQNEPQLDADQISGIERDIGAGLIEEVIEVAEGELKLVDTMVQSAIWEDLEEKPVEGQWTYFEREGTKSAV